MEKFNWSTLRYFMFTRKTMENLSWKTLLYFMSEKEKTLTGEHCDNSCPRSRKFRPENFAILHVYQVEKFNWRTLGYILSTKWNRLTGELKDVSCVRSEKL